jgi:hypothetical protein
VHGLSESVGVGVSGIEVAADPLQSLVMLLMAGIGNDVEELTVAPGTTDILRRTSSGGIDEARIDDVWHGIGDALDTD